MSVRLSVPSVCDIGVLDQDDHIVLYEAQLPSPKGGGAPQQFFGPCLLWPNGWVDQCDTDHGGGPRSRPLCARWGLSYLPNEGTEPLPIFGPFLLWQTA